MPICCMTHVSTVCHNLSVPANADERLLPRASLSFHHGPLDRMAFVNNKTDRYIQRDTFGYITSKFTNVAIQERDSRRVQAPAETSM